MSLYYVFDKSKVHTGNAEWQYKITRPIEEYFPEIKFSSWQHDAYIKTIFVNKNKLVRIFLTFMVDFIYLVTGVLRLLTHPKQILGIPIMIILFLILIFPPIFLYRVWVNRNVYTDASLTRK